MSGRQTCQQLVYAPESRDEYPSQLCGKPVHAWRECGAGCKKISAFCKDHGGDEKAQGLMRIHVAEEHPQVKD